MDYLKYIRIADYDEKILNSISDLYLFVLTYFADRQERKILLEYGLQRKISIIVGYYYYSEDIKTKVSISEIKEILLKSINDGNALNVYLYAYSLFYNTDEEEMALFYAELCVNMDIKQGHYLITDIYENMSEDENKHFLNLAKTHMLKANSFNNIGSIILGDLFLNESIGKNTEMAKSYYKLLAGHNRTAFSKLINLCLSNDDSEVVYLIEKFIRKYLGTDARNFRKKLCLIYTRGTIVEQDLQKALSIAKKIKQRVYLDMVIEKINAQKIAATKTKFIHA